MGALSWYSGQIESKADRACRTTKRGRYQILACAIRHNLKLARQFREAGKARESIHHLNQAAATREQLADYNWFWAQKRIMLP